MEDLKTLPQSIFNEDFKGHQCHKVLDEVVVYQKNPITKNFLIAHQMLYSYGLTSMRGTADFAPERTLTRAEAARFMVNFAKNVLCRKANYSYTNQFTDVETADSTLIPYIRQAYEYKLFHGDGGLASKGIATTFRPNDKITYDELSAVIVRLVTNEYNDADEEDWAKHYKAFIASHTQEDNQTSQTDSQNTTLSSPLNSTSRGAIAQTIYALYSKNHYAFQEIGFVIGERK